MEKFRRESGFIDLDKIDIEKQNQFCFDGFFFVYEGTKYYFKKVDKIFVFHEVVGSELAKDFGIDAVDYDIACCGDDVGNLSKNFHKPTMLYLETILRNFYPGDVVERCNLNDVLIAIDDRFPIEVKMDLEEQLIDLLMFDLIIGNPDRHPMNIIIDMKTKSLGPVFDNELMLSRDLNDGKFYFSIFGEDSDTLGMFLNCMDDMIVQKFVDKVEIINKENIAKVFERIEKRIGAPIDIVIKNLMVRKFEEQYAYLQGKIKEYNNRRKLSLGKGGVTYDNN